MKTIKNRPFSAITLFLYLIILSGLQPVWAATTDSPPIDITQVPIEQLVETEFIPASRIARQISDAPSAVSIVTAQDIRDYGYRSLSDILKSMRGLYVTPGLAYEFLGGRGFGTPGDYAGRIMLMIDGYVTNDNFLNQIYLGEDALLDVAMIERVEFIPGPGSTSYGNGAFLGVINVVTKRGRDFNGAQVAVDFGEHGAHRKRLTYGRQLENGAEFLFSASKYEDDGTKVKFASLDNYVPFSGDPFTNQAIDPFKKAENRRLFFKGSYEGWTLEAANVRRTLTENAFFDIFEPSSLGNHDRAIDDNGFASLKYDAELSENLKSSSHVYYGQYLYRYDDPQIFQQQVTGRWWGADFKFVGTWFDRHKLLFGGEYRDDYRQHYWDSDSATNQDFGMRTTSLYVQDEYRLTDKLTLTPGFRYDNNNLSGETFSPRFAVIYSPWASSTFKLSYGKAFRNQNAWERSWSGKSIDPESVTTTELVWQQQLAGRTRLTASAYHNRISERVVEALFNYHSPLDTVGQEVGIEHVSQDNLRLNASVAHQISEDDNGNWLVNSPHWLGKLNVTQPLFQNRATLGVEVQAISPRIDASGTEYHGGTLTNLTLSSGHVLPNTFVSLSVRNLFDIHLDNILDYGPLAAMPESGRNVWLQLEYNFK